MDAFELMAAQPDHDAPMQRLRRPRSARWCLREIGIAAEFEKGVFGHYSLKKTVSSAANAADPVGAPRALQGSLRCHLGSPHSRRMTSVIGDYNPSNSAVDK